MTPQKAMNRALRLLVPMLFVLASVVQAETRYVDDVIYVPVRSGPGIRKIGPACERQSP